MTGTVQGVAISALPNATLPLTGTEALPINQAGVTRQVSANDLTGSSTGAIYWSGVVAAALAAGTTNDWAPDLTNVARIEVAAAGAAVVTGLAGGVDSRVIVVTNVGLNDVTLYTESLLSVAANRFVSNGDTLLMPGLSALFIYSAALGRWTKLGV